MEIKIDLKLLDEQIKLLDVYASIINDVHKRDLVDGVINLLDRIEWALEEGEEINFVICEEV